MKQRAVAGWDNETVATFARLLNEFSHSTADLARF